MDKISECMERQCPAGQRSVWNGRANRCECRDDVNGPEFPGCVFTLEYCAARGREWVYDTRYGCMCGKKFTDPPKPKPEPKPPVVFPKPPLPPGTPPGLQPEIPEKKKKCESKVKWCTWFVDHSPNSAIDQEYICMRCINGNTCPSSNRGNFPVRMADENGNISWAKATIHDSSCKECPPGRMKFKKF